jgi:hypothetical protein
MNLFDVMLFAYANKHNTSNNPRQSQRSAGTASPGKVTFNPSSEPTGSEDSGTFVLLIRAPV